MAPIRRVAVRWCALAAATGSAAARPRGGEHLSHKDRSAGSAYPCADCRARAVWLWPRSVIDWLRTAISLRSVRCGAFLPATRSHGKKDCSLTPRSRIAPTFSHDDRASSMFSPILIRRGWSSLTKAGLHEYGAALWAALWRVFMWPETALDRTMIIGKPRHSSPDYG